MMVKEIKLYEDRDDVTLTTYVLQDSLELLAGKSRPAVLICPGGAYLSCSDREAEPVALRFAAMGYHAFVLRYSTYFEGQGGFPDLEKELPVKEHCIHPRPMQEIGAAMLRIRDHAKEWRIDTQRIAVCGFSAGGHNAAMYATNWHTPLLSEHFGRDMEEFRPAAAILGYALSDYIFMNQSSQNPFEAAFFAASNTAFLGSSTPSEELLEAVSPARHVTAYTPPMFLWATAEDPMVPVEHTLLMAQALAAGNIPFEVHIFEEGDHGLSLASQATAQAKTQVNPDASKWVELAEKWLEKRFRLPLMEKTGYEDMLGQ